MQQRLFDKMNNVQRDLKDCSWFGSEKNIARLEWLKERADILLNQIKEELGVTQLEKALEESRKEYSQRSRQIVHCQVLNEPDPNAPVKYETVIIQEVPGDGF